MFPSLNAAAFLSALWALSQGPVATARLRVVVTHEGVAIAGATVAAAALIQRTDSSGTASFVLPPGIAEISVTRLGFTAVQTRVSLREGQDTTLAITLTAIAHTVEEVLISTARSERRVGDLPVRVEVIDEEEVAEKTAMTPGDLTMMLNETSGLRIATTAPSLGAANVRMQGLRGRYSLVLMDGLPVVGGSGSLGLQQTPPVDLARVEVIKGNASALYGAAALGGVINLISRRPREAPQRELLLNATSRAGQDLVFFAAGPARDDALVPSLLVSTHQQRAQDVDRDGWIDVPGYSRVGVRPRVHLARGAQQWMATLGVTREQRRGGTLRGRFAPDGAAFPERLGTRRFDVGVTGRALVGRDIVSMRGSFAEQRHDHVFGPVSENDRHRNVLLEATAAFPRDRFTSIGGVAMTGEQYRNRNAGAFDFDYWAPSVFGELNVDLNAHLVASASSRLDRHNTFGALPSVRGSLLVRFPRAWTGRVSAGLGAFAPTPFVEATEAAGFSRAEPNELTVERGRSASLDVTGQLAQGTEVHLSSYMSRLTHPVATMRLTGGRFRLENSPLPTLIGGAEALLRIGTGAGRLTASYAFMRATEWEPDSAGSVRRDVPLAPRHTAGLVGSWEREASWRAGLEIYFTGRQALEDNPYRTASMAYSIVGVLLERYVSLGSAQARLFINGENLTNKRLSRYHPLVRSTPGLGGRWTTDAWTELAGATVNGGVRVAW